MRKAAILAGVLTLSACAYPNPQHVAHLDTLIGKSEADLVRDEGVPTQPSPAGGLAFAHNHRVRIA